MTDTETEKQRFSMLYRIGTLSGLLAGLFMNFEVLVDASPDQQRDTAVTGFYAALGLLVVVGILERLIIALMKAAPKVGGIPAKPPLTAVMKIILFYGLAAFSIGVGIFISSLWRGEEYIRGSLQVIAPSAGLLLGLLFRRFLFIKNGS